jgi:molybdenum cofactor synthesis domain-containing protein
MTARTARVVAASNRASAGVYADRTGPVIVEWLRARGYQTPEPEVVPDGEPVREALRRGVAADVSVIITTGGTGLTPTDHTPEVTADVLDFPIPGLADAVRAAGFPEVPTAVLSRGLAGVSGRTLIVNLPGSRGGVRDGLGVLDGVLDHAVDQIHGGDHPRHPPIAATGASVLRAEMTEEPLEVEPLARLVEHRAAGAVVTFGGVVRDHDGGRGVRELEYEGHPNAANVIAEVADDIASGSEGVRAIAVAHRIGRLGIGDVALACAVAAEHRKQAFHACSELVDEVKRRLPIWKRQVFDDGTEEWVNCP